MDLGMLLVALRADCQPGFAGLVPDRAKRRTHRFLEHKEKKADERFENSNDNRVLPGANGRSILARRKGGRVEQENQ
jgi:hypothetical protein